MSRRRKREVRSAGWQQNLFRQTARNRLQIDSELPGVLETVNAGFCDMTAGF